MSDGACAELTGLAGGDLYSLHVDHGGDVRVDATGHGSVAFSLEEPRFVSVTRDGPWR